MKHTAKNRSQEPRIDFEELYIAVRQQEMRIYTDEQLQLLPDIDHIYFDEWKIRKRSSERLTEYLIKKHKSLKILEVGCGNGWLSAKLANIPNSHVTGLDINQVEIDQANRVFKKDNLAFIYDSFTDGTFESEQFDVIVFAASLQYFPSVINVMKQALAMLKKGGEVHVIDTPFYTPDETEKANERSLRYYASLGIPEMAEHYFHHSISEFWGFKYEILFDPTTIFNLIFKKDPFYWVCIRK
ncbi:bifunctional 2-polyprenyl-6-hydroxyphenol methylase/3-demethylubiquinol 3-O-methyltransferase UbiG [Mucilaginibacter sp. BT774]|uniref:class I SAM-dependent methyltransferase n=1 Tax=Mucilaginibacter sp. BT774 TaxID=3062276 RepID=UPI0026748481|nr:class I SAM-dependent methyltransferase [Mucilaginibacter sp. BT774]MDO3624778.1 class I SAM-dependent methyltransferase [Mucilaginibacter sp. BT774]